MKKIPLWLLLSAALLNGIFGLSYLYFVRHFPPVISGERKLQMTEY